MWFDMFRHTPIDFFIRCHSRMLTVGRFTMHLAMLLLATSLVFCKPASAALVTFENGVDSVPITVSEPGIQFTTTQGYDWIFGDWRTGKYNGPYPRGSYYSFGNFFAWLGPNQGQGRIDFDTDVAEKVTARYSSYSTVKLEGYDAAGNLLLQSSGGGNLNSGGMATLSISKPGIAYVLVHDSGNYWLVDNLDYTLADVRILEVDLQEDDNETSHRTDRYDPIVLRRAQDFTVNVVLSPGFDKNYYDLTLILKDKDGNESIASPGSDLDASEWHVAVSDPQPRSWLPFFTFDDYVVVPIKVYAPYDLPVGKYQVSARMQRSGGVGSPEVLAANDPVYFIFNPWSQKDDDVYSAGMTDSERDNFTLAEDGVIYTGDGASNEKSWGFEQFNTKVFESTIGLVARLPLADRANAWRVTRHLSAVANVQDDGGVLTGNWSGNYTGGESPGYWSNSSDIFSRYTSSGSVKFGQCWVFAGILNSMGRTLGIPTRVVTNTPSAHDTVPLDGIITTYTNNPPPGRHSESIWNFHVWNEAWLKRPDRANHSGIEWQTIDGTPQEQSAGLYQTGPAPVTAIKANAGGSYDVDFIRYEVQAKKEQHFYDPATGVDTVLNNSDFTSTRMPTNGPGSIDRLLDYCSSCTTGASLLTLDSLYASTGNSIDAILSSIFRTAHAASSIAGLHNVTITVNEPVALGGTASGTIKIVNTGEVQDTAKVFIFFKAKSSNGTTIADWGSDTLQSIVLQPGEAQELPFNFAVPLSDRVLPGYDFYAVEVAVVGNIGAGGNDARGSLTGISLSASSIDTGENGEKRITASLVNNLSVSVSGVVMALELPNGVTTTSQNPSNIGAIAPGQTIPVAWDIKVPSGRYNLKVSATADGIAPIYQGIVVTTDGPPNLKLDLNLPDKIPLGQSATGTLIAKNTGSGEINVRFTVNPSMGLGGVQQNLPEIQLGNQESKTLHYDLNGSIAGAHPVAVTATQVTPSGEEVYTQVSGITLVQAGETRVTIQISPPEFPQGPADDADIFVMTEDGSQAQTQFTGISSDSEKRYALYDGTKRILAEPVDIPPSGKHLSLQVDKTTSGGWIRITASPIDNLGGSSTATLNIAGSDPVVVVDDRIKKVFGAISYNRRTNTYSTPVTITNTSPEDMQGPVRIVISGIKPNQAKLAVMDGALADGRPYIEVAPSGSEWASGQSIQSLIQIVDPSRSRIAFETQVLATVPSTK